MECDYMSRGKAGGGAPKYHSPAHPAFNQQYLRRHLPTLTAKTLGWGRPVSPKGLEVLGSFLEVWGRVY